MLTTSITIIGAGPAGAAAALQCTRLGVGPLLLDSTGQAGGLIANAHCMENYLGHPPVEGFQYVGELREHLDRFGIAVAKQTVRGLFRTEGGAYRLETERDSIETGAVIVAVGTLPKKLSTPGADDLEGRGLYYDVVSLNERPLERALIVGVGEAALDYSLSLAKRCPKVVLLARGGGYKARGRLVDQVEQNPRIETRFQVEIERFESHGNNVRVNCRMGGDRLILDVDAVVAALGRRSALSLLSSALDLTPQSGVSTPFPGLYVAGDARSGTLGQVGMAVGDGLDAAMRAVEFVAAKDED